MLENPLRLAGQEMNLETDPYDIGLDNWIGRNDNLKKSSKRLLML